MIMVRMRALVALILLLATSLAFAAEDSNLSEASNLIKANDYQAAYRLLEPLESERAGDVDYDYIFGLSAVESGNVTRGVFALERVLATNPNHSNARAEIAKAYFKLGETETSKAEFRNVLNQKPPKEVSDAIEKYMSAIDKSLGLTTTFGAYLDFGIGYDTNINSGTASGTINAAISPGGPLVPFTLNSASKEQSSSFMNPGAGISFRHPFAEHFSAFGSANYSSRMNWSDTQFDTESLDGSLGISYKKFIDTLSIALQASSFDVDGNSFRRSYGATGQWQHDIDDRNQLSLYAQGSHYTYPTSSIRDSDRYIVGGGWGHVFAGDKAPFLFLGAYGGKEETDKSSADFLSNTIYGVRVGGQFSANYKLVAYASGSYESRHYDAQDPSFVKTRDDDQFEFAVGLKYRLAYEWTIKPQLSYLKNNSNISLFEFDRTVLSVNFRKDFSW